MIELCFKYDRTMRRIGVSANGYYLGYMSTVRQEDGSRLWYFDVCLLGVLEPITVTHDTFENQVERIKEGVRSNLQKFLRNEIDIFIHPKIDGEVLEFVQSKEGNNAADV